MKLDALLKAAEAAGFAAVPDDEDADAARRASSPDIPAPRASVVTATALVPVALRPSQPQEGWAMSSTQALTRGVYALLGRGAPA
jgi:hypothetical protein